MTNATTKRETVAVKMARAAEAAQHEFMVKIYKIVHRGKEINGLYDILIEAAGSIDLVDEAYSEAIRDAADA